MVAVCMGDYCGRVLYSTEAIVRRKAGIEVVREQQCSGAVMARSMFLELQLQGNMSRDSTLELQCLGAELTRSFNNHP